MDLLDETKILNVYLMDIKSEQQRVAEEKIEADRSLYPTFNTSRSS